MLIVLLYGCRLLRICGEYKAVSNGHKVTPPRHSSEVWTHTNKRLVTLSVYLSQEGAKHSAFHVILAL